MDLNNNDEILTDSEFMDDESIVNVPMDSRYLEQIIDGLWNDVSDRTFHQATINHPMFDLVLNRLEVVNHWLYVPRSTDQLRVISQYIVTSYDDERIQELIYFILQ